MPNPKSYDSKDEWMDACMSTRKDEHPDEDHDQSVAICLNMWRDKDKKKESASEQKVVEAEELSTKGRKRVEEHNFAAPSSSPKVNDGNDHFPIQDKSHAENARSRVMQYDSAPDWWDGSLKELQEHVFRSTAKEFDFGMEDESKLPSKRESISRADAVKLAEALDRKGHHSQADKVIAWLAKNG